MPADSDAEQRKPGAARQEEGRERGHDNEATAECLRDVAALGRPRRAAAEGRGGHHLGKQVEGWLRNWLLSGPAFARQDARQNPIHQMRLPERRCRCRRPST